MAIYKVVDAEKLDADLKSVADKLREKSGTTEEIEFPHGFNDAVDAIQTGGDANKLAQVIDKSVTEMTAEDFGGAARIGPYAFYNCQSLASVTIPNSVTSIGNYAFYQCSSRCRGW